MAKVAVRRVNEWDGPAMLKIYAPYTGTCAAPEAALPPLPEYVQRIDRYTYGLGWLLCEIDYQTAGFCHLSEDPAHPEDLFSVEFQLYVKPGLLRRGIGKALWSLMRDMMEMGNRRQVAARVREENQEAELAGLDLSSKMIARAREKNIPNAQFLEGDAEHLPYPTAYFDMVSCVQSFHHYPNPEKALAEVRRVLWPGGVFLLCDMYVANPLFRWLENMFLLPALRLGDVHTYGRKEICALMEAAGFSAVAWKRAHPVIFLCRGRV